MTKGRVFTGARARLLINGVKVGYARNVRWRNEYAHEPVEAIDNIEVEEHVPTRYRVELSFGAVKLIGDTLRSLGYMARVGTSAEEHTRNVHELPALTCTVEDNKTGALVATFEQVKLTSEDVSVEAGNIVGSDVTTVAVRMRDETEI